MEYHEHDVCGRPYEPWRAIDNSVDWEGTDTNEEILQKLSIIEAKLDAIIGNKKPAKRPKTAKRR